MISLFHHSALSLLRSLTGPEAVFGRHESSGLLNVVRRSCQMAATDLVAQRFRRHQDSLSSCYDGRIGSRGDASRRSRANGAKADDVAIENRSQRFVVVDKA